MKINLTILAAAIIICAAFSFEASAQANAPKAKQGKICGNPKLKCRTGDMTFPAYEIAFESPRGNYVVAESETFYAIVLKSAKLKADYSDCETAISEKERLQMQTLFPDNKVFALKCSDAGSLYYTNFADNTSFIAVYAGKNVAEANAFLKIVQKDGKFKGASVRRTRAQINGT